MTISLASLHECIEKHAKPEKSKLIESIATIIFNEAPDEFIGGFTVEQLCTVSESILSTLQDSTKKFPQLRALIQPRKPISGPLISHCSRYAFLTGHFSLIQSRSV